MKTKTKRASMLAVIIYVMINVLAWGLMKVYINSYNTHNHEKLVMAEISDKHDGKEVEILGNRFFISEIKNTNSREKSALKSLVPFEFRVTEEIFTQTAQEIFQALQ